jgi:hypothetical protein
MTEEEPFDLAFVNGLTDGYSRKGWRRAEKSKKP